MSSAMPELPEGPVTIMFTDIEGSTALRTSLGDSDTDTLFKQHDELVRAEIEANRGHDQKAALGDGFLAVFVSTRRALAAAVGIQRSLDSFNRNRPGAPLRVRIGLNTGEVTWQDGQLSGESVHAASRVCAAAEGSQILVSDVTRQLAGTVPDTSFLDTGEHDLKGFPQPWRLWEVIWIRETMKGTEQVFVGRDKELGVLRTKLNAALDGRGSLVLVGGEPGVGKTTLVKQLIREAEQRGALAVFGRCYESEGAVPYSPFVEMLEAALAIMPPEIVREDMDEDAPEIARLVPELRRRFPDIPEPLDLPPEQQRRYFFNAVASFIGRGATRFPLVLVMDDVHWADESTLLLIEHMADLMPDMRVLGVGTYRDVELDVSRPLAATLERMLRARTVERLPVKRFDRNGVATMIQALAGKPAPDAIVGAIYDETEGNPFFVEEVFRHLVEERKVFDEAGNFRAGLEVDELDVPESVRLVVGRRLERLGAEAQKALAAGAVVGRGFPFSLLEEITDIDTGRLLDIVEEAEAARVIVPEERDGEVHYAFAHELIRQTLLASLSLLRRQRMHLTVANAIERTDPTARTTRSSEIANHLLQAGAAAEAERTLDYLERAADRAMEAAAFEEALRSNEAALQIADPRDLMRFAGLEEKLGWSYRALGDFEKCLEIWARVLNTYEAAGEIERAADLCREMAYQYLWLGRFDDVLAANQRGLDILGDRRVASRAYHLAGMGALLGVGGFFEAAREHIAQGEEIALEIKDDRALGWVNWTRCVVAYSSTLLEETIEAGETATAQLRRGGDTWTVCDSLSWTALALVLGGSTDKARSVCTEALELSRRLGHRGGEILAHRAWLATEAIRDLDLGRWEQGVRRDIELCESINSPWSSQGYAWLGAVVQMQGRTDEALGYLETALEIEPVSAFSGLSRAYTVLNHAYAGNREAFVSAADAVRPSRPGGPEAQPWGSKILTFNIAQGSAFLELEQVAAEIHEHVIAAGNVIPLGFFDGALARRIAGMTATLLRRWDEAEAHFMAARQQAIDYKTSVEPHQVEHWYGKMLLDRGRPDDRERATEMVGSALEWYRAKSMPLHAAMAEELLKKTV